MSYLALFFELGIVAWLDSQGLSGGAYAVPRAFSRACTWLPLFHCSHWDINGVLVAISGTRSIKSLNTAFASFLDKAF